MFRERGFAVSELLYGELSRALAGSERPRKRAGWATQFCFVIANFNSRQDSTPNESCFRDRGLQFKSSARPNHQTYHPPGRRPYTSSQWVVFTATERAYQPRPSPTRATRLRGSRPPQRPLLSKFPSSRKRGPRPVRLAKYFAIRTVSPRPRVSSATTNMQSTR